MPSRTRSTPQTRSIFATSGLEQKILFAIIEVSRIYIFTSLKTSKLTTAVRMNRKPGLKTPIEREGGKSTHMFCVALH